jgi:hypothetical protein
MRICRWCGTRVRLLRTFCRDCRTHNADAGIYLQSGGPPCPYMARLPKAGA